MCCNLPVVVENHPSDGGLSRPSASIETSVSVAVYVIEGLRSLSMALALKNTCVPPEYKIRFKSLSSFRIPQKVKSF